MWNPLHLDNLSNFVQSLRTQPLIYLSFAVPVPFPLPGRAESGENLTEGVSQGNCFSAKKSDS